MLKDSLRSRIKNSRTNKLRLENIQKVAEFHLRSIDERMKKNVMEFTWQFLAS